jgi:hypothetical protein
MGASTVNLTAWELLLKRRTVPELEATLAEALAALRSGRRQPVRAYLAAKP